MKYFFLIILLGIFTGACNQSTNTNTLEKLKKELAETKSDYDHAKKELAMLKATQNHDIMHVVFFKLKPESDPTALIKELKKIGAIEGLEELEVGTFKDLKDKRAMSEFRVVMQMGFDTEAAYQAYQKHPLHIELKNKIAPYLAGPPVSYDFTIQ